MPSTDSHRHSLQLQSLQTTTAFPGRANSGELLTLFKRNPPEPSGPAWSSSGARDDASSYRRNGPPPGSSWDWRDSSPNNPSNRFPPSSSPPPSMEDGDGPSRDDPWNNDFHSNNNYNGPGGGDDGGGGPHLEEDAQYYRNLTTGLATALPLIVFFVIAFILYKTWPKPLQCLVACISWFRPQDKSRRRHSVHFHPSREFFNDSQRSDKLDPAQKYYSQVSLNKITIGSANIELTEVVLGRGEYGLVTKGYASGLFGYPPRTLVAIKTMIRPDDPRQRDSFRKEIETMVTMGRHLNIVNLLGTVAEGNLMLVMEYCVHGSLKRFLKKQRPEYFYNHVNEMGYLLPFNEDDYRKKQVILDRRTVDIYSLDPETANKTAIATKDLIALCYQISRGLEFLASNSLLHRDIAARNVLVTDKLIAKLSDFGMAKRVVPNTESVEETFEYPMPVKWMAPEALVHRTFSQKTDVWSFGMLVYEIFSLGEDPFTDIPVQGQLVDFIARLMGGYQMQRPLYFPSELFVKVAVRCWELSPTDRPTFVELREVLEDYVPLWRQEEYLEMNQEYESFNQMFGNVHNNAYVDINYEQVQYINSYAKY